jgi:hypothetical protein
VPGADPLRRDEPLVGVGGRHADVRDRHVRLVGADLEEGLLRVLRLAGDLEAAPLEDADQPLAHEHVVVGDYDPHGISAALES